MDDITVTFFATMHTKRFGIKDLGNCKKKIIALHVNARPHTENMTGKNGLGNPEPPSSQP
jgi:hypothetical protein